MAIYLTGGHSSAIVQHSVVLGMSVGSTGDIVVLPVLPAHRSPLRRERKKMFRAVSFVEWNASCCESSHCFLIVCCEAGQVYYYKCVTWRPSLNETFQMFFLRMVARNSVVSGVCAAHDGIFQPSRNHADGRAYGVDMKPRRYSADSQPWEAVFA
jgi:hypothetical protein